MKKIQYNTFFLHNKDIIITIHKKRHMCEYITALDVLIGLIS